MNLGSLTKLNLVLLGEELGIELQKLMRKPEIIEAISTCGAEEDEVKECNTFMPPDDSNPAPGVFCQLLLATCVASEHQSATEARSHRRLLLGAPKILRACWCLRTPSAIFVHCAGTNHNVPACAAMHPAVFTRVKHKDNKLVLPLQQDVAPIVYVFKVLSRCFNPEDADAERNKKNACLLNRKLMATLKRWPCVRILNTKTPVQLNFNL
ncbi:hypothetical protein HPB51_019343 [Rhipicephalus microplus]|uniref:Uncharacterized protein n=1 Tax=Rhipicephalus microplus TaxID=6941 RepID=A0A9J6D6U3_RHIMP|nr:hypothetical protein HPB51_019343 [Rhipicephalus microplus]